MKKRLNAGMVDVNGKTVTISIDVHKLSWQVTALVEGVVVRAVTIKLELIKYLNEIPSYFFIFKLNVIEFLINILQRKTIYLFHKLIKIA